MFLNEDNKPILSTSIFLITLLVVVCIPQSIVTASKGPDDLEAYAALEMGEVDIVGFPIQGHIYLDAIENPNVVLAPIDDMSMYQFDINNNCTIPSYPGVRSPTDYKEFRQALAFLVDKDRVVDEFCGGFAVRIDQPIAAPTPGWMNKSYTGANYPYEYDPAAASALLDAAGFTTGTTLNPYYDPAYPGSTTTLRTYPPGHSKAGQDLDNVIFYVRTDDPRRFQAGRHLYQNARKIGIPFEVHEAPSSGCYPAVMDQHDYHLYTGGWSTSRFPTYLCGLYTTEFYELEGPNYVVGVDCDGITPNHPKLTALLCNIRIADTSEEAFRNVQLAMGLFTELCVTIPLFSPRAYWGYSSELLGVVNMDAYGFENNYLFMNAYKVDGSPIRWGLITPANALNILYAGWRSDEQCLYRVYLNADFDLPPYNIVMDQPSFVLDWFADTWDDNGTTKAKNFKRLRPDNYFVDTEGNQLANVDADDYLFSNYMVYAIGLNCWVWSTVSDVKFFNKVNDTFVEIYYDARSYWLYTSASPPLIPRSVFLNTSYGLTQHLMKTLIVDTNLTTPGFMGLGGAQPHGPCWVNSVTSDLDGVLTEWVDFHWELGDWYMDTPLTPGAVVTVDYYAVDDASGYTLGDNLLEDVTVGCGMYYFTGFFADDGGGWHTDALGNFTARRNPYYYLETPILGEIDFVWEEGGYYEVTIFDIVKAAGAYGSQGIAVPDDNWFPGADVTPPGGVIDIFDIVTVAGKYAMDVECVKPMFPANRKSPDKKTYDS
jgi:ABC-type transport system substrate-binding protein